MAFKILWSAFSEQQLDEIFEFHKSKVNLNLAKKIINELVLSTKTLEKNPLAGKEEELLIHRTEKYRYLVSGNYKIIYSVDEANKLAKIADVFDTRQNPIKIIRGK